jgi:hypothetical protein
LKIFLGHLVFETRISKKPGDFNESRDVGLEKAAGRLCRLCRLIAIGKLGGTFPK